MRQLGFALLDMAWHTLHEPFTGDITGFERGAMAPAEILPPVDGTCMSVSFGHLFAGGYAAGYYGYKWAEVLDADAFSLFRERGILDRETASSFRRNILERGGSREPDELFRAFRGREPSIDALIERSGFRIKEMLIVYKKQRRCCRRLCAYQPKFYPGRGKFS